MDRKPGSIAPAVRRMRADLVERFPLAFAPRGAEKRPLKIGIREDIIAAWPDVPVDDLKLALSDYAGGFKYLQNETAGAVRIDLDGQPAGIVTEDEAAYARSNRAKRNRAASARLHRRDQRRAAIDQSAAETLPDLQNEDAA